MSIYKINGNILKKALIHSGVVLRHNKELIDALNVFPVPDGDTGTNMSLTMDQAVEELKNLNSTNIKEVADTAAWGCLMGARGNSGVILSQLFRGFAQKIPHDKESISTLEFANAFQGGVDAAYHAVMRPVEGTILTVARKTAEKMLRETVREKDFEIAMNQALVYAERVLERTPEMLPALKEANVVDAGGQGLVFLMKGFLEVIKNPDINIEDLDKTKTSDKSFIKLSNKEDKVDIKYIYCTEFIVEGKDIPLQKLKKELEKLGDSFIIAGDKNLIKAHIHSNNPGLVLEEALKWGELSKIKIDNMKLQHNEQFLKETGDLENDQQKIGVIAVSQGDGLDKIFRSIGCDVIEGGQSMNPSTENILNAVKDKSWESIIILPNNKNIIMTAQQAKQLSAKEIHVVETKTIPQGISAMLAFNPNISVEENVIKMSENIKSVVTGEITYAVRDSEVNGTPIKRGDILGIKDGKLIVVDDDIERALKRLIKKMTQEKSSGIITIYYGKDVDKTFANQLAEKITNDYEDFDVETYAGGQSLYQYLVSVE